MERTKESKGQRIRKYHRRQTQGSKRQKEKVQIESRLVTFKRKQKAEKKKVQYKTD